MSSDWPQEQLSNLVKIKGGKRLPAGKSLQQEPNSHPYIRVRDVGQRELPRSGLEYVPDETFPSISRYIVEPNDVVLSIVGTIGALSMVDAQYNQASLTENCVKLHGLDHDDALYLYYYLVSPVGQQEIHRGTVGAVQPKLPIYNIEKIGVAWPDREIRELVSTALGVLDDRIALLRETNATLEAIAQALFKSWFVDFDPVRAKMEGRAPEGMDEATAALFPESFEESELGLVPRGWSYASFIDTVDVIGGGTPKTSNPDYWDGDIPWYSVVDAPSGSDTFVFDTEKHITEAGLACSSTKLLPKGTTIISARGTVGKLAVTGQSMAMNQSCYGLRGKACDSYFTYFSTFRLVNALKARSHGSVFDTITRNTLASVKLVYPGETKIVAAFEKAVNQIMERILLNLKNAKTLDDLRDTLLPRLISGQIRPTPSS